MPREQILRDLQDISEAITKNREESEEMYRFIRLNDKRYLELVAKKMKLMDEIDYM